MLFSGFKKRSIADQIDTFGFDFSVSVNDLRGSCEIGFSGDHVTSFSFASGKIFDPHHNFVSSYEANQQINIAGQIGQSSYDYSINGNPIAQGYSCNSGKHSWFFVNAQPDSLVADVSMAISGNYPDYQTSGSGYYLGSGSDVKAYIFNETPGVNFRIFDVEINGLGGPYSLKSFTSGDIATSGEIVLSSNSPLNYSTTLPVLLHTNFGDVNFDFFIGGNSNAPGSDNSVYFSITPNTQNIGANSAQLYSLYYSSYPSGAMIDVSLGYASGFTGDSSQSALSSNFLVGPQLSGEIQGSGYLSQFYQGTVTGYDPIKNTGVSGSGSGYLTTAPLYATGPVSVDYYIKVTGFGEGTVYDDLLMQGYAEVQASGYAPFVGEYVSAITYDVMGSGGLNQTATIPVATGSVFLYPTGTAIVHFEPNEYSPVVLIKDESFVGPVAQNYDLLGVGFCVGPTLSGIVDSNFKYVANPGNYTFTKSFNNLVKSSGFMPSGLFNPVMCSKQNFPIVSGLISGTITSGGFADCSSMPDCLGVSGIPSSISVSGATYANVSVIQIVPDEGFPFSENSVSANAGGYTRTSVSNQNDPSQALFDQIVQGCDYFGQWAQRFNDIRYSGYQLIPQLCDPYLNSPTLIRADVFVSGFSVGSPANMYPTGLVNPSGYLINIYERVESSTMLLDYANSPVDSVSYKIYETNNMKGQDHLQVGYNPVVREGQYQNLGGIILDGNNYTGNDPRARTATFDISLNFPDQNFDAFIVRVVDSQLSLSSSYWNPLSVISDEQVGHRVSIIGKGFTPSGLNYVNNYPTDGAPNNLRSFDLRVEKTIAEHVNLRFTRTARAGSDVFQDFQIYGVNYSQQLSGQQLIPYPTPSTPDSGILNFSIVGNGNVTNKVLLRASPDVSGFRLVDLSLYRNNSFYAYNSGASTISVAPTGYFDSSAALQNINYSGSSLYPAFVLDLPTGNYQAVVRGLGSVDSTNTTYLGPGTLTPIGYYNPPSSQNLQLTGERFYYQYPDNSSFAIVVPYGDPSVVQSGSDYYYKQSQFVPGDPFHSGRISVEMKVVQTGGSLLIKDVSANGNCYNNNSVDCSLNYNTLSHCQAPALGWVGESLASSSSSPDFAVIECPNAIFHSDGSREVSLNMVFINLPGQTGLTAIGNRPGSQGYGEDNSTYNPNNTFPSSGSNNQISLPCITGGNGETLFAWSSEQSDIDFDRYYINFKAIKNNYPNFSGVPVQLFSRRYYTGAANHTYTYREFSEGTATLYFPYKTSNDQAEDFYASGGQKISERSFQYALPPNTGDNNSSVFENILTINYAPQAQSTKLVYGSGLVNGSQTGGDSSSSSNQRIFQYGDFYQPTNLQVNHYAQASVVDTEGGYGYVLRLTDGSASYEAGSAYYTLPTTTSSGFNTHFQFRMSDPGGVSDADGPGGDGMAFLIQTSNNNGAVGGGLGYGGISPSIAVEFDTYKNTENSDIDGNHVGINLNGNLVSIVSTGEQTRFNNGSVWDAWIQYDQGSQTMRVYWASDGIQKPSPQLTATGIDLNNLFTGSTRYVGFTAAQAGAFEKHDVLNWWYDDGNDFENLAPAKGALNYYENGSFVRSNNNWINSNDYSLIAATDYAPFSGTTAAIYSVAPRGTLRTFSFVPSGNDNQRFTLNADPVYNPPSYWYSGAPYVGSTYPTSGMYSGNIQTLINDSIWMNYDMSAKINNNEVFGYSLSILDNVSGTWSPFAFYGFAPSGGKSPCVSLQARLGSGCTPLADIQDVCITGEYLTQDDITKQVQIALKKLREYQPVNDQGDFSVSSDAGSTGASGYFFYTGAIVFNNPVSGDVVSFASYQSGYTGRFSGIYGMAPTYPEIDKSWVYGSDFNTSYDLANLINQSLYAQSYNLWVPSPCDPGDRTLRYEYGPLLQANAVSDSFIQIVSARQGAVGNYRLNVATSGTSSGFVKKYLRPSVVLLQAKNNLSDSWTTIDSHTNVNWDAAFKIKTSGYLNNFGIGAAEPKTNNSGENPAGVSGSTFNNPTLAEIFVTGTDSCDDANAIDIIFKKALFSGTCDNPDPKDDDDDDKDKMPSTNGNDQGNPPVSGNVLKTGWVLYNYAPHNYYRISLSGFATNLPVNRGVSGKDFCASNVDFYGLINNPSYFTGSTTIEGSSYSVDVQGLATGRMFGTVQANITADMTGVYSWKKFPVVSTPYQGALKFNNGTPATLVGNTVTGYLTAKTTGQGLIVDQVRGYFYDDPTNDVVSFSKTISGYIVGSGPISGGPFNMISGAAWKARTKNLTQYVETTDTVIVSGIAPHVEYPYPVQGIPGYSYLGGTLSGYVSGVNSGYLVFDQIISDQPDIAYQDVVDSYDNAYGYLKYNSFSEGDTFYVNNIGIQFSTLSGHSQPSFFSTPTNFVDIINNNPSGFGVTASLDGDDQYIFFESLVSGEAGNSIPLSTTSSGAYFNGDYLIGGADYHLEMTPLDNFSGYFNQTVAAVQDFFNVPSSGNIYAYLGLAKPTVYFSKLWDLQTGTRLGMLSYSGQNWFANNMFKMPSGLSYSLLSSLGSFNIGVSYFGNAAATTPDVATLRISGVNFPAYLEFNITGSR